MDNIIYEGRWGTMQIMHADTDSWYRFKDRNLKITDGNSIKNVLTKSDLSEGACNEIEKTIVASNENSVEIYSDDLVSIWQTPEGYQIEHDIVTEKGSTLKAAVDHSSLSEWNKSELFNKLRSKGIIDTDKKFDLVAFAEQFFGKNIEIMKRKNQDYAGGSPDPFANFRSVEVLGIAATETGFLTRMMDKLLRINNIIKSGKTAVLDEQVEDTLSDLSNYAMLMAAYLESKKCISSEEAWRKTPGPAKL